MDILYLLLIFNDDTATYRDLDQLALSSKKIPHLHSKLHLNEGYGIVTSMNLLLSSEINSLEIGYATKHHRTEYNIGQNCVDLIEE